MRYAIVIPDGAADRRRPELQDRTPLEAAEMPALSSLVTEGSILSAKTVPLGMAPGSDVCCLSVLGYDPANCYTGRAPLEAAAQGLTPEPHQAVFRANTVTIEDGLMVDYAAGHISTEEAAELIDAVAAQLDLPGVSLHAGVQYRHLCILDGAADAIAETTPPHDILERSVEDYQPRGGCADLLGRVAQRAASILADHPVNRARRAAGKRPATHLWLWGGGTRPSLESYADRFGLEGGLISAVDLLRGIARLAGLEVIDVPGATGYYDTDYAGKGAAALACLEEHSFVAVHIEAPDEASHNGDVKEKIRALEQIDRHIIDPLAALGRKSSDLRLLVMPDHPTPVELRTHSSDPVPACLWGPGIHPSGGRVFSEHSAQNSGICIPAHSLLRTLTAQPGN